MEHSFSIKYCDKEFIDSKKNEIKVKLFLEADKNFPGDFFMIQESPWMSAIEGFKRMEIVLNVYDRCSISLPQIYRYKNNSSSL